MYQRLLLCLIVLPLLSSAQLALQPRVSPLSIVTARYKDVYLKIVYSQPQKRGREVLGKLVPYGQVWRTGANEATEITLTKDMVFNSQKLKAGTYSVFTIPNQTSWTIIVNTDLGLWGSYNYNQKMDVMRFEVPAETIIGAIYEPFTITIDQKTENAIVSLLWDKTRISFPIQFIETK
ncbi:MAG: DUF2911 domain-containing protein [Cyclobacteriaceae bacterium]|nr:DUF2911 domain-containing protein [Cyclobacteriaceae bacterium]